MANYQQYYQYYPYYYNNRGGSNGFGYGFQHIESSNVPSSAGDSQNEDEREGRSDNDTTPTTATTTTSNSPKKEATKEAGTASDKIIPGLNLVKNPTRQTKKRRKKKSSALQLNTSPSIEAHGGHHRGSSSSEANEKNVLKAITILQRNTEAKKEATVEAGTSENSTPPTEENFEATEVEDSKIEVINELELEDENEEVIHVVVEDFSAEAATQASEAIEAATEASEAVEAAKEVENVASIEVIEEQHIEVSLLGHFFFNLRLWYVCLHF